MECDFVEVDPSSISQCIFLVVLLMLSAFFSAAETSFTSLGKLKLKNMVDSGVKGADRVDKVLQDRQKFISAILVGNNLANISASAIATSLAIKLSGNSSIAVGAATGLLTLLVLIFGEITPKSLAVQRADKLTVVFARPVYWCMVILTPIVWLLNKVTSSLIRLLGVSGERTPLITEAELMTIVNVSHEEGVLETGERQMIYNVFEFGDMRAKDIMIPRMDIVGAEIDASYEELFKIFDEERFTRIPVYRNNNDDIIGILNIKDFIFSMKDKDNFSLEGNLREPYFTYENKSIAELFNYMQTERIPMAIVLDEYGGTSGLLTLEDIIEEIMGDISDEYDEDDQEITLIREHEYVVDGSAKIDDVNEMIGTELTSEDYDSIGGYVMGLFDRIPEAGEQTKDGKVRFIVESLDKNRIEALRIHIEA